MLFPMSAMRLRDFPVRASSPRLCSAELYRRNFFFQAEDGIRDKLVTGVQTCALPISLRAASPADRVEVDLTTQVLYVVKGGAIARILPVSSGNGATYKQKDGSKARALTRSEERRVGKECRNRCGADHLKKQQKNILML